MSWLSDLYQSQLGRAPEAGGAQYWNQQLQSGALTQAQITNMITGSAEAQQYRASQPAPANTGSLYGLLGGTPSASTPAPAPAPSGYTTPTPEQLATAEQAVNDLSASRGGFNDPQFGTYLVNIYDKYLGRAPDAEGVNYYTDLARRGFSAEQIENMMKYSAEGQQYAVANPKKQVTEEERIEFINKVLSDNDISEKEAQRALNRGITLDELRSAYDQSFETGNPYSRNETISDERALLDFMNDPANFYSRGEDAAIARDLVTQRPGEGAQPTLTIDRAIENINDVRTAELRDSYTPLTIRPEANNIFNPPAYDPGPPQLPVSNELIPTVPGQPSGGGGGGTGGGAGGGGGGTGVGEPAPAEPITAKEVDNMSPFGVNQLPITIGNPYSSRVREGIAAFDSRNSSIQNKLVNI